MVKKPKKVEEFLERLAERTYEARKKGKKRPGNWGGSGMENRKKSGRLELERGLKGPESTRKKKDGRVYSGERGGDCEIQGRVGAQTNVSLKRRKELFKKGVSAQREEMFQPKRKGSDSVTLGKKGQELANNKKSPAESDAQGT